MWLVAGCLLGSVVLLSLLGLHTGPHSHVAAGVIGTVAAIWLVIMAATGNSSATLWSLLGADLVVSGGIAVVGYKAIRSPQSSSSIRTHSLQGSFGTAVSDLSPDGVVRVNGETWSATSLNGSVDKGSSIQVVSAGGVRLEVWGEPPPLEMTRPRLVAPAPEPEQRTESS